MLRRTALLAALALGLSGCVTYEVVEHRHYDAVREVAPYGRGDAYGHVGGDRGDRRYDGRDRYVDGRAPYDLVVIDDDPYERWFYGWRGYGPAWSAYPWHEDRWYGSPYTRRDGWRTRWRITYGWYSGWSLGYGAGWGYSPWSYSPWSYSPWGYSAWAYDPWRYHGGGYYGGGYYGGGYWNHRPRQPQPQQPRPQDPQPMPKPFVRAVGPDTTTPVIQGPMVGGEPLRPVTRPRGEGLDTPVAIDAMDARPMGKPWAVTGDTPPQGVEPSTEPLPRTKPDVMPREEPIAEAPRFEPREEPRYEEPRYEEPRYEEPRYEEPRYEEPRYEEPRYEEPRYEEPRYEEPRYEEPRYEPPPSTDDEPQPLE